MENIAWVCLTFLGLHIARAGNDCINCCEKNAGVLGQSCTDLNSQMHGVCGAAAAPGHSADAPAVTSSQRRLLANSAACNVSADAVLGLIDDLDEFVGAHPKFLLGTWLADSKLGAQVSQSKNHIK